jgi:Fe-S cluster biogenesis protein NfuA
MEEMILKSLEKIRPALQRDGGDVKFIDVNNEGVVTVQLQGACGNCPGALMTIKMFIEEILKNEVPGVKEVIGV